MISCASEEYVQQSSFKNLKANTCSTLVTNLPSMTGTENIACEIFFFNFKNLILYQISNCVTNG